MQKFDSTLTFSSGEVWLLSPDDAYFNAPGDDEDTFVETPPRFKTWTVVQGECSAVIVRKKLFIFLCSKLWLKIGE